MLRFFPTIKHSLKNYGASIFSNGRQLSLSLNLLIKNIWEKLKLGSRILSVAAASEKQQLSHSNSYSLTK